MVWIRLPEIEAEYLDFMTYERDYAQEYTVHSCDRCGRILPLSCLNTDIGCIFCDKEENQGSEQYGS